MSMVLFTLCLEPLIRMIDINFSTSAPNSSMFTVKAYADDVVVLLRNQEQSRIMLRTLEVFEQASGALVNFQKSALMPFGNWPVNYTVANIPIVNKMKILGMMVMKPIHDMITENWKSLVNKIRIMLLRQRCRNLNLIQKIWYINQMALSKIWFMAQVLPIAARDAQRIELSIGNYLWNGNLCRIARTQLRKNVKEGGLGLIDVSKKCHALLSKNLLPEYLEDGHICTENHVICNYLMRNTATLPRKFIHFRTVRKILIELPESIRSNASEWKTKVLYKHLMDQHQQIPHIMNKFPNYNWGGIWRMFTTQHIPTAWKSTAYLVVNDQTPTEVKKYMHNIARSSYFLLCGRIDTIRHRLSS